MFRSGMSQIAPVLRARRSRASSRSARSVARRRSRCSTTSGPAPSSTFIDPVPGFTARARAGVPGRYYFHESLSLDVLPDLEPMDAALIDRRPQLVHGLHELRLLADVAGRAGAPLPVMVMHDVLCPTGAATSITRRTRSPTSSASPTRRRACGGREAPIERGGLNPDDVQRRSSKRSAQRCHDRARRLPSRNTTSRCAWSCSRSTSVWRSS